MFRQGKTCLSGLTQGQQTGDLAGAGFCHVGRGGALGNAFWIAVPVLFPGFVGPEHQAGLHFPVNRPDSFGAMGVHTLERQR